MKLACVIHRYGREVTGGSEAHCRAIAHRLAARHDVTVLTSRAIDYITWADHYPAGESADGAVRVHRFGVRRRRPLGPFRELSDRLADGVATPEEQERWFTLNGPEVPGLLAWLDTHAPRFDGVLFWSFRYYPAWFGLPRCPGRSILVPTAEEDDLIRHATILGPYFAQPRGFLFLTPEEQALVAARCDGPLPPSEVIGSGLDPAPAPPPPDRLRALGLPEEYLLYVGRVDRNKGCDELFAWYAEYAAAERAPLPLVLAGPIVLPVPAHPSIRALGRVDDALRDTLLAHARALVMPSPYESLSLVVLEAWNRGTPVIVNGRCRPLRGQVLRANGGVYYERAAEFAEAIRLLASHRELARTFGRQGLAYVEREYRWPVVMGKVEGVLERTLCAAR
ncbi:MAG TPA: glycosyltransferase family 4 protein [Vicinamibacterales bacterium]